MKYKCSLLAPTVLDLRVIEERFQAACWGVNILCFSQSSETLIEGHPARKNLCRSFPLVLFQKKWKKKAQSNKLTQIHLGVKICSGGGGVVRCYCWTLTVVV